MAQQRKNIFSAGLGKKGKTATTVLMIEVHEAKRPHVSAVMSLLTPVCQCDKLKHKLILKSELCLSAVFVVFVPLM